MRFMWLVPALLGVLLVHPATAQYQFSTENLYANQEVMVTFPTPSDTLIVTYRPNSSIPIEDRIPTNAAGAAAWTPRYSGVVALATPGGPTQNVSVRFLTTPWSGVVVLTLAGLILFGGIIFSFRKLFSTP
jgi:hypothetical protein